MTTDTCPVCGGVPNQYSIDNVNLEFLRISANSGNVNEIISVARIVWRNLPGVRLSADSKIIIDGVSASMLNAIQAQLNEVLKPASLIAEKLPELIYRLPDEMTENVNEKVEEIKTRLVVEFKEALSTVGFPEPEQMKVLSQLIPSVLPLLQELLRLQKVPMEKGRAGELELLNELRDYFPEDDYKHIGGPGDTDIVATPTYGGFRLNHEILIESKKNNSGWDKAFIDNVRRHMKARGNHFALLAVEIMPTGAKGFLIEHSSEGAILIISRKDVCIAYGALRAVFIAIKPFELNVANLQKLLTENEIENIVKDAMNYQQYVRNIKTKATRIISNSRSIVNISDELDAHLKECLIGFQERIRNKVKEIVQTQLADPKLHQALGQKTQKHNISKNKICPEVHV